MKPPKMFVCPKPCDIAESCDHARKHEKDKTINPCSWGERCPKCVPVKRRAESEHANL